MKQIFEFYQWVWRRLPRRFSIPLLLFTLVTFLWVLPLLTTWLTEQYIFLESKVIPDSLGCLFTNGTVIYLYAQPEALWERVRNARHRPMLQAPDPRLRLIELFTQRDPLYREVADHVVPSERDAVLRFVRSLETGTQEV